MEKHKINYLSHTKLYLYSKFVFTPKFSFKQSLRVKN